MTKQIWLGWGFFASLALNVFLTGAFIGQYFTRGPAQTAAHPGHPGHPAHPGHPGHPVHPAHPGHPARPGYVPGGATPHTGGLQRFDSPGKRDGGPGASGHLAERRSDPRAKPWVKDGASAHSVLREMGRAMGGRNDPRVVEVLKVQRESFRAEREAIQAAKDDVRRTLVAEPFDQEALQRALAELLQRTNQVQVQAQHSVVRLASQMKPEERERLRQHLTQ